MRKKRTTIRETPKKKKNYNSPLQLYGKYSGIAFQMIIIIAGGVLGGQYIDKILYLKFPVFTIVLSLLSIFLAIYYAVKEFLR